MLHYSSEAFVEKEIDSVEGIFSYVELPGVTWVDVNGLSDLHTLETLGEKLGLHPLALEDVLNTGQRPKVDDYEDHAFVVLKQLRLRESYLESEQVSMFFGKSFVLMLQESPLDDWEPVRQRIRGGRRRIRSAGSDYLVYALVDAVIDSYFPLLEEYGDRIEELQVFSALALCFGFATLTSFLGLSTAVGAFVAGILIAVTLLLSPLVVSLSRLFLTEARLPRVGVEV